MSQTTLDKAFTHGDGKDSFRDRIATVDAKGKRKWVFAQKPKGKFYNIRTWVSWAFFALFFSLPFIEMNGHPLFLFNIPEAKFILFGKIFWPQDFFIFGIGQNFVQVFLIIFRPEQFSGDAIVFADMLADGAVKFQIGRRQFGLTFRHQLIELVE